MRKWRKRLAADALVTACRRSPVREVVVVGVDIDCRQSALGAGS